MNNEVRRNSIVNFDALLSDPSEMPSEFKHALSQGIKRSSKKKMDVTSNLRYKCYYLSTTFRDEGSDLD